jgi:ribosomal-protein-alanine N-acetyltransferase
MRDRSVGASRYGYIYSIYVVREYRGFGYGSLLIEHFANLLRENGIYRMHLDVSASNESAIRVYHRLGFYIARHQMELKLDH